MYFTLHNVHTNIMVRIGHYGILWAAFHPCVYKSFCTIFLHLSKAPLLLGPLAAAMFVVPLLGFAYLHILCALSYAPVFRPFPHVAAFTGFYDLLLSLRGNARSFLQVVNRSLTCIGSVYVVNVVDYYLQTGSRASLDIVIKTFLKLHILYFTYSE